MKTSLCVLAVLLSSLSLGFQMRKTRPVSHFDKYLVPAQISDYEYRRIVADQQMIKDSIVMRNGIGVPFVRELSDDHQQIVCRALVSEPDLPKSYDARKQALLETAWLAVGDAASEFDLDISDKATIHTVRVEFLSIQALTKGGNPTKERSYAAFTDGELVFN